MIFLNYEKADSYLFKILDLQVTLNHTLVLCLLCFRGKIIFHQFFTPLPRQVKR